MLDSDRQTLRPLTRAQVRRVDQIAIEHFGIPGIVLMENAALHASRVALSMLTDPAGAPVLVICGSGNNGGDGLAISRHLHNSGVKVTIALLVDPAHYTGDALINWRIVERMKLSVVEAGEAEIERSAAPLLIDAIFGTGLTPPPRDPLPALARAINSSGLPVLAIDLPSGLDCDTGLPLGDCIRATKTVTFVAEKLGFANPQARQWLGEVVVADIGCPREAIARALAERSIGT